MHHLKFVTVGELEFIFSYSLLSYYLLERFFLLIKSAEAELVSHRINCLVAPKEERSIRDFHIFSSYKHVPIYRIPIVKIEGKKGSCISDRLREKNAPKKNQIYTHRIDAVIC